jgi:ATP-binding cassette, subfamily C, bacterial
MRYQWVNQQSGEDCAAASLAIVIKHYGHHFTINHIRELIGTGKDGTTMLGMKRGAESLGFVAKVLQVKPSLLNRLETITLPAIIYWKGYHFVVLYGKENEKYVISDPALGVRYLERAELLKDWQGGVILLLKPTAIFSSLQSDKKINILDGLIQRLYPHRVLLAALTTCNFALGILSLTIPLFSQYIIDDILLTNQENLLKIALVGFTIIQFIDNQIGWLQSRLGAKFALSLQAGLKTDYNQQVLHLPITYHESRYNKAVGNSLQDTTKISSLISQLVVDLPIQISITLSIICILGYYNLKLALIVISVGLFILLITALFQPWIKQATQQVFSKSGHNLFTLSQIFSAALMIKTIGAARQLEEEIQQNLVQEIESSKQEYRIILSGETAKNLLFQLCHVGLIGFSCYLVLRQDLTVGQFVALTGLSAIFIDSVRKISQLAVNWTHIKTVTQGLTELFDCAPENQADQEKSIVNLSPNADITCRAVSFSYPGRVKLLDDFSVTIPGGKITAIIGHSGCGKSSLAKLFVRLYTMQDGNIFIDKYDSQDLPLDCLRQQVTLVPQEATFLTRSIIDNLRLGKQNATLEQLIDALKIADAYDFIDGFPEKYNTIIGAFSANLSGGQKQRIAIARAVLQNPPILILDESTANLDPPTEAKVLGNLLAHRQDKTTILISHRPRVINCADWIVFMEEGKLKFQGSIDAFRANMTEHLSFINP